MNDTILCQYFLIWIDTSTQTLYRLHIVTDIKVSYVNPNMIGLEAIPEGMGG